MTMLVYLAGPYSEWRKTLSESGSGGTIAIHSIERNIQDARKVAIELWEKGYSVLCPHLNTARFEEDCNATYMDYLKGDLRMLAVCDAVVMLPHWEESNGARAGESYAHLAGIPVYEYPQLPEFPGTLHRCPDQAEEFLVTAMRMYRTHLAKNADYSPANISGTGMIGLTTRIWDKTARILSLIGFNVKAELIEFTGERPGKNESIEDNLLDLAVYAVNGLIFRKGGWGK